MQSSLAELETLGVVQFGQCGDFYALRLSRPDWPVWNPGQFVMLRPAAFGLELPWARPFSICHLTPRHLICFFQVRGKGTQLLARLKPGDPVLAWGPLGTGFAMEQDAPVLLLAGGMGIAPFIGYVYRHPQPWNLHMLFGHRWPIGCYPVDSLNERIPVDSMRETEPGELDNFIYAMQEKIRDCAEQNGLALACGPEPFLANAKKMAAAYGCRLQISLERRMACGVGACLGCVCKQPDTPEPVQTCLHGPVFWAEQVEI